MTSRAADLFRGEALEAVSDRSLGVAVALVPWSWLALTAFLMAFAVSAVVFLATATFPRKEAVAGVLQYSGGAIRVVAPRAGIVTAVEVSDGQEVHAGDHLAYVTTEQFLATGSIYDKRLRSTLKQEIDALRTKRAALDQAEPLRRRELAEQIAGASAQLDRLTADATLRDGQAQLADENVAAAHRLAVEGTWSYQQERDRRIAALSVRQDAADLEARIASLRSQRADLALQPTRLPSDFAQQRADIDAAIGALREKDIDAMAQNGFALVAKVDGTVTALQARVGDPVDTVRPLMTVVPRGSELRAELYVPSRAIGFVTPGQHVRLLYDAFPYTRFGPGAGAIADISTAVLKPEEVAGAVKVTEPVYRVTVRLAAATMSAYGHAVKLQSGMALTADILLEKRSFLALLLDPLLAARGRVLGGA
jgi:membrane fusion protein